MNLLENHLKKYRDSDEAILNYIQHVQKEYPPLPSCLPMEAIVKFDWVVYYHPIDPSRFSGFLKYRFSDEVGNGVEEDVDLEVRFSTFHLYPTKQVWYLESLPDLGRMCYVAVILTRATLMMFTLMCLVFFVISIFDPKTTTGLFGDNRVNLFALSALFLALSLLSSKALSYSRGICLPSGTGDTFKHGLIGLDQISQDVTARL